MTFDCFDQPSYHLSASFYLFRHVRFAAQALGDQVPGDVKKRRTRSLKRLSRDKNSAFRARHVGIEMKVLLERDERTGLGKRGYTDNYLRVEVAPDNTCLVSNQST